MAETPDRSVSRRGLLKSGATGAAALGMAGLAGPAAASERDREQRGHGKPWPKPKGESMIGVPFEGFDPVRVGIIGLGNRGSSMLPLFLAIPGIRVTALCDVVAEKARKAARQVTEAGQPEPALYTGGERDFENLCARDDVDFVYSPTPWGWHVPVALTAMRAGKHVGIECPFGLTMKDLWDLVDTSEVTRRHCIQLENVCYGRTEMRLLRMAHEGLFGDLLHGAGAYIHDLRELLFSDTYYEEEWRRAWHTELNGDLYPTHGLGPIAAYMDVNRGDRLTRITSMGSPALSLAAYREEHVPRGAPEWKERYVKGDMTVSLVQTALGRVIRLEHNVSSPHPYTRRNIIGGTKGAFEDYPPRIYLEPDMSGHQWGSFDDYASYDHWLWKEHANPPGGHGGMDYIMVWRLAQTLRMGLVPDMDVYDSAAWSAPVPLSVESIRRGSEPMDIPDFTRGNWEKERPGLDSEKPD